MHFIFDVILRMSSKRCGYSSGVERNLAKVDVVGPNPIARSNNKKATFMVAFLLLEQTMGKRNREGSGIEQSEDEQALPYPILRVFLSYRQN